MTFSKGGTIFLNGKTYNVSQINSVYIETIIIRKSNEGVNRVSKYTIEARNTYDADARTYWFMEEQEKEFRKEHEKKLEMSRCINRYRNGNHPFALAMTACKTELFYRESNKETTDENQ